MVRFRTVLFVILGILLQQLIHHIVEISHIGLLLSNFDKYGLGLSWDDWFMIHHIGSFVLLAFGIWFGWWLALNSSKWLSQNMNINNFFKLAIAIVVSSSAGVIGAVFTEPSINSGWYDGLVKSALNPPGWIFGPVWSSLYVLMGISLYLVWKNNWETKNKILQLHNRAWNRWSQRFWAGDLQKQNAVAIFAIQLFLNAAWSYIFFGLQQPDWAFFVLLALWWAIIYTIINFFRISKMAAYLLVPYILWVSFAGYLNYLIWMLNKI